MTCVLFPRWLLASYPPCYHLLLYIQVEMPFSKSKLSLSQTSLETANSGHRLHNLTLWKFFLPALYELSPKYILHIHTLVPQLEHAFFSASSCLTFASHSPDFTDFKAQRHLVHLLPWPGHFGSSRYLHIKQGDRGHANPFQSLKIGLLHTTCNG